jgi:hypothetical protein
MSKNIKINRFHEIDQLLLIYLLSFLTPYNIAISSSIDKTFQLNCKKAGLILLNKFIYNSNRLHLFDFNKINYGIDLSSTSSSSTTTTSSLLLLNEITKSKLFLLGGGSIEEGLDSYRRTDRYDMNTNTWLTCKSMSKRRGTFKTEAVEFAGLIVVISGDDHSACGTIEAYNPFSNEWFDFPSLPRRLMLVGSSAMKHTLYVTGGLDKDTGESSDNCYSLNIDSTEWTCEKSKLLKGRYGHGQCSVNNKMYIAGGQVLDLEGYTNTVEVLDPLLNTWVSGPSMLKRRIWLRLLNIKNELYAVGGDVDENGSTMMPSIEKLDSRLNQWVHVTEFTILRRVFSVTSVDDNIYIFGGRDADYATLSDWDKYNVEKQEWESTKGFLPNDEIMMMNMKNENFVIDLTKVEVMNRNIPREKFYGGQAVAFGAENYDKFDNF